MRNFLSCFLVSVFCVSTMPFSRAHFPWLVTGEDGKAALFFGEGLTDRAYAVPDSVRESKLFFGRREAPQPLKVSFVERDDFTGLVSAESVQGEGRIWTDVTYGVYHGNRLDYRASHLLGTFPANLGDQVPKGDSDAEGLHASLRKVEGGTELRISFNGKPLSNIEVHLYAADWEKTSSQETGAAGTVVFSNGVIAKGLNGIMFGHTIVGQSGRFNGTDYESEKHYQTITFQADVRVANPQVKLDDLPFAITSFGAARLGNKAYVYGGHTGEAHSYSTETQSQKLLSLDLSAPDAKWTVESTGKRLQGLAMVPHKQSIILIGGFTADNEEGEEHDLHSQVEVRSYDTVKKTWADLPALPAGRSSHDAAILGDKIYVVGGWTMDGENETVWQSTALCLDLSTLDPQWEELPAVPFTRRALATVAHAGKVFVIGGMDKNAGPTREVAVFDPSNNKWSTGPKLVGKGEMAGFGVASWSIGGKLIVSTYEGDILKLSEDEQSWTSLGTTQDSRFFHRLLPHAGRLIVVGGANMEQGKYLNLEILDPSK